MVLPISLILYCAILPFILVSLQVWQAHSLLRDYALTISLDKNILPPDVDTISSVSQLYLPLDVMAPKRPALNILH
jgi:hypothetical protein